MAQDEFERLLERCNERLSEITLSVPDLETGAPRAPVYSLEPAPAPPPPRPPEPEPVRPPEPETTRGEEPEAFLPSEPAAAPEPLERRGAEPPAEPEEEVFPPPRAAEPATPEPHAVPTAPTPASASVNRGAIAAAAGLLAAAGACGVWLLRRPAPEIDIEVGGAEAMAVRPEKGDLLVAEGRELVDLSRDGRTLGRTPLDAPVDTMCWYQGTLWTADGRAPKVVQHGEDGRTTVFSLNHVPGALYVKDRYLWTAEKTGGALHQFLISRSILGAMLQPLDSFELNGLAPESFTIDDSGTLWVADAPTRRLYRLRLENGAYKRLSSAPLSPVVGPEGKLRNLTVDGDGVWILADQGGGRVALRRIAVARLDWTPS